MRWTPAGDGNLAQPLLGRHAEREDAQYHDGVAAAETIHEAVAAAHPDVTLSHPQCHRQALHSRSVFVASVSTSERGLYDVTEARSLIQNALYPNEENLVILEFKSSLML